MNLNANKVDGTDLPITVNRIAASEWNQLAASCMAFIRAAGFTPDSEDNQQLLNAFIKVAEDLQAIGANVDLSNLSQTGKDYFLRKDVSNIDMNTKLAIVGWGLPNMSAGVGISSGAVLPVNALVVIAGNPQNYGVTQLYVDGHEVYCGGISENSARHKVGNCIAKAGSVITTSGYVSSLIYYPLGV